MLTTLCITAPVVLWVLMRWFRKKASFEGTHVFISGGSTGIGLALARELALLGASITIIARTTKKLEDARTSLEAAVESKGRVSKVHCISADVSVFTQVVEAVKEAEDHFGHIDYALCCAGASYPGNFLDQELQIFEKSMQLDYFGSFYIAKAVLPSMVRRRSGHILFTASPLATIGYVGFTSYCPPKYALRGLADVLRNELAGTNVNISVAYPLDTDTPGLANENLTKPAVTEAITRFSSGAVCSAEKIARSIVHGLQYKQYHIKTPDFIVNLLISSMSNITPKPYPLLLEVLLAPFIVLALAIYRKILDGFVLKYRQRNG